MGKTGREDKSDGIEIISIGKLYTGPWDKKYWSSSRGKDRYPYPVGYKSVRTQNGVTYTMEIIEGLKGPSFTISSTDGKSCSGGTPDIAWQSFQKKGCSNLWRAKRFSSKIDGVEFFGFKNTFVQRLLRELVANVGGTTEQSLIPSNFSGEARETADQCKPSTPDPDLLTYLVKSHTKGKRSRNDKVVSSKRFNGTNFKQDQQEACTKNISSSTSNQRDQSNCRNSDLSPFAAANEFSSVSCSPRSLGPQNLASITEKEKYLPIAERGVNLDSLDISDHLKVGGALSEEEREPTSSMNHLGLNVDNLHQEQEPSDKSRYYVVQDFNNILPQGGDGAANVQHDTPVLSDSDLCAADSLARTGDSFSISSLKTDVQVDSIVKDATIKEVAKSEVLATDSLPEDELDTPAYNTNSEKCDTESVDQELAQSMMTVLLPRAVPLLKTFSRKKKKGLKPSQTPTHVSQEENNTPNISTNDLTLARGLAQHSDLERENGKACVPCANHDSVVSTSGNSASEVPDSFDSDGPQDLLPHSFAGQLSCGPSPHAQLPINVDAEADPLCCHSGSSDNARGLAEHSDLEIENDKACVPCADHDSVVSTYGNSASVVPDSFDNDGPQDLLPHACAAQAGRLSCGPYPHAQLLINVDAEADPLCCHSGSSDNGTGTAGITLVAATDTLAPVREFAADTKRARFDCHSIDNFPSIHASTVNRTSTSESIMCRSSSDICTPAKAEDVFARMCKATNFADCDNRSSNLQIPSASYCSSLAENIKMNDDLRSNVQDKVNLNSKLQGLLEFFACYIHPTPISMVQLIVKQNEIFICVKCGCSEHKEGILFVYKTLKTGEKMGCPSLIGHVPIALEVSKDILGKDISFERCLLQLTPEGQSLVLSNSIKLPYCREGKLHCSCPACTSDCSEKNAVKIVTLNRGYASLVTRLKTTEAVCCLLVCEPSFLLAAEESGKLKLWVMKSGWSGQQEDWYLPTFDCMFPRIVELRTVPNSAVLVVGHNGSGEFFLWDINKRHLVSRFSSPGMSVLECIPASVFRWQRKEEYKTQALVNEIMDATEMWFSGRSENHIFSPEDKDVAVWLLISTVSDPESQRYLSCEREENASGCWRLALLVNNTVITGSIMEGRATAAATSYGHGVIGTEDGQVYMWDLSTGMKLGNLHSFKGSRVSCFTSNASNSGALAVASEGQLLIYLPS